MKRRLLILSTVLITALIVSACGNINDASTDDTKDTYMSLAEQYAITQIPSVESQQEYWHTKQNSENNGQLVDITAARVDILDYAVSYEGYKVYKFVSSYLPDDPSQIISVDEWELGEDGWYTDLRPRYLIFSDADIPELIGEMRCEFSPDGYSEGFYNTLDTWIKDLENTTK